MDADFEEEDVYGDQRIPGAAGSQPQKPCWCKVSKELNFALYQNTSKIYYC